MSALYAIALFGLGFLALFGVIRAISPTALRRLPPQNGAHVETGRGGYITLQATRHPNDRS